MALNGAQINADGLDPHSGTCLCPGICSSFCLVSGDVWEAIRRALLAMPPRLSPDLATASDITN